MLTPLKRTKIRTIQFKITENDFNTVKKRAKKEAGGNLSKWIRKKIIKKAA